MLLEAGAKVDLKDKVRGYNSSILGIRRVRSRMPRAAVIIRLGDTRRGACPFADLASTKARSLSRSG